jgi:hypothetical protein
MVKLKINSWNIMYLAAIICALFCVATVYQIVKTNDPSNEWIIDIGVILGFCLFGYGFLSESKHNSEHTEQSQPGEDNPKST